MLEPLRLTSREKNRFRSQWSAFRRWLKKWTYYKPRRRPSVKLEVAKVSHRKHARRRH